MSNADLIERLLVRISGEPKQRVALDNEAADALAAADKRIAELECKEGGGCTLAGPGRGDCEHAVGLPGKSIPGQHDGQDDTVDAYGKPNGWCWSCWKSKRIAELEAVEEMRDQEIAVIREKHGDALGKLDVAREALQWINDKYYAAPENMVLVAQEALAQIGGEDE